PPPRHRRHPYLRPLRKRDNERRANATSVIDTGVTIVSLLALNGAAPPTTTTTPPTSPTSPSRQRVQHDKFPVLVATAIQHGDLEMWGRETGHLTAVPTP